MSMGLEFSFKCPHQNQSYDTKSLKSALSLLHFDAHMTELPCYRTVTAAASEVEDIWWSSTWHGPERYTVLSTVLRHRWPDLTNWMLSTTDGWFRHAAWKTGAVWARGENKESLDTDTQRDFWPETWNGLSMLRGKERKRVEKYEDEKKLNDY